ncbi:RluA family pseudouridine synthase [Candidatus Merdisoma sp. JLR.KK011]|uniref:RluA family pseudouridine synthase n=1 Tax=Candidatus Merdisoma sp. JLR.KK011 TaxID=3114299 RepID=UPI002FF3922A
MEKRVSGIVEKEDEGIRLGHFLRKNMHLTKNEISRAKFRQGGICVNGERRKVNGLLKAGDFVEALLETEDEVSKGVEAFEGGITVLYEDQDVVVVDKPSGLKVHPTGGTDDDTLANRLAAYLRGKGEDSVIRIFGRLDKDTSGAVLAVKNRGAAVRLERQREQGQLFKSYLAIVEGTPEPGEGKIDKPLRPVPGQRNRMYVDTEGKRAVTYYTLLDEVPRPEKDSLVGLRLETGRTHQIRVHMASIGCPLLGDPLYGKGAVQGMERTALHAWRIHFLQPFTGEEVQVEAPLPEDMRLFLSISSDCFSKNAAP